MAANKKITVDWFPHAVIHGDKMYTIETKYQNNGYALWFKLLEELGKAKYHYIDLRGENADNKVMFLVARFKVTEEMMWDILGDLARIGAINKELYQDHNIIFSEKFIADIEAAYKQRQSELLDLPALVAFLKLSFTPSQACNESIELNPDLETGRGEEIRIEEKRKEKYIALEKVLKEPPPIEWMNDELLEAWDGFLEMRIRKRKPMTARAQKMVLKKLYNYAPENVELAIKILDQAVEFSYDSVYPLKKIFGAPTDTSKNSNYNDQSGTPLN